MFYRGLCFADVCFMLYLQMKAVTDIKLVERLTLLDLYRDVLVQPY